MKTSNSVPLAIDNYATRPVFSLYRLMVERLRELSLPVNGYALVASILLITLSILPTFAAHATHLDPPASVDLDLVSPTEGYHVRIDPDPLSDHYYPVLKALSDLFSLDRTGPWSVGNPQGYDHGYELLGFTEPVFTGSGRNIFFWDCKGLDPGCDNGYSQGSQIVMPAPTYINKSQSCTRMILGHELMHRISGAYLDQSGIASYGGWVTEGHARALQDKIYTDLDTVPSASCIASFLGQVEGYLKADTNTSLWNLSYDAALWWTYLMEQYGFNQDEPSYGADFLVIWYALSTLGAFDNSFAVTDNTIKFYDFPNTILSTYRRFVLANIIKDMQLAGYSQAFQKAYSYVDEQGPGQDLYGPVVFADNLSVSNGVEDTAIFTSQDYAVQYFKADISACSSGRVLRVGFEPFPVAPIFDVPINQLGAWGVVVGQSNSGSQSLADQRPARLYKKVDEQWAVEFFQPFTNPYETAYITTTGIGGLIIGTLRVSCLPNPPNPLIPNLPLVNMLDPVTPGLGDNLTYGEVCVRPSSPLPGLDPNDYTVAVGDQPARVLAASADGDGHCLTVEFPIQTQPGPFDLAVSLGGSTTVVPEAVIHNQAAANVLVAIDTSTTMLSPSANPKLDNVRDVVSHFIGLLQPLDSGSPLPRVGLIGFSGNNIEPDDDASLVAPLLPSDATHLDRLETGLNMGIASGPNRLTSIGDAIQLAIDEFAFRGDPTQARHLVLISDGSENEGAFWQDLESAAINSGVNIHTLALGPLADQPLLYQISKATGGQYWYVDVDGMGSDFLALSEGLAHFAAKIGGLLQIGSQPVMLEPNNVLNVNFVVPPVAIALLLPAVQQVAAADSGISIGTLTLIDPSGFEYPTYQLRDVRVDSFRVATGTALLPGIWTARIQTNANASEPIVLNIFAEREQALIIKPGLSRPESEIAPDTQYVPGDAIRLNLVVADTCALGSSCASGDVQIQPVQMTRADGSSQDVDLQNNEIRRLDLAGSPLRSSHIAIEELTLSSEAIVFESAGSPTAGPDDGVTGDRGSYTLKYQVDIDYGDYTATIITRDAFAVRTGAAREVDTDGDGAPDAYEDRMFCLDSAVDDSTADPDADGLSSQAEYQLGTHPCVADTDAGGETDGSEVAAGREPLRADDDALSGIDFAVIDRHPIHEGERSFIPGSIILRYGADSRTATVIRSAALRSDGDLVQAAVEDHSVARGEIVVTDLVIGNEYCFRLEPFDALGNAGRPSEVLCGFSLADPANPWGDIVIADGRPRTDDTVLNIELSLYNKDPGVSEMRLRQGSLDTGWVPYSPQFNLSVPSVTEPTDIFVSVKFRDLRGLESISYFESIMLYPSRTLGGISGRVLLEDQGPQPGVLVWLSGLNHEPPAVTDANGNYRLTELIPGSYNVTSDHIGWSEQTTGAVGVAEDLTAAAPELVLPLSELLFGDGFEN